MILAANFTWDAISQLTVSGIINGAAYGLLGAGFALILGVTGRFHFAYGFTYALAAYLVFWLRDRVGLEFWLAAVLGILGSVVVGVGIERCVYRPVARRAAATALLSIFVASLGIAVAGQNVLSLLFSSASQQIDAPAALRTPIHWGPTVFRWLDVWQVLSAAAVVVALALVLKLTPLGRAVRATRGNPEMARIIGIDPHVIYLVVFAIGTAMCGLAAFWFGVKYSVQPDMGFTPVVFAFVVAFLAGTASSPIRVFVTGIVVGLIEQLSTIWLEVRWSQLVVFVVLLLYLVSLSVDRHRVVARLRAGWT